MSEKGIDDKISWQSVNIMNIRIGFTDKNQDVKKLSWPKYFKDVPHLEQRI